MKLKSYQNLSNLFNFKRLTSLSLMVSILSCSKAQVVPEVVKSNAQQNITIDVAKTFQKIQHFGASDAWSCQFVGNWSDANKNAIADLL